MSISDEEQYEGEDMELGDLEGVEAEPESGLGVETRDELQELQDKYLRVLAEFDNFRKRATKDRSDLLRYQGERLIVDLLDVMDNLELALQYAEGDPSKLKEGIQLIHKLFVEILGKWEVRSNSLLGKDFDPAYAQAISKVPAGDEKPNLVVSELRKPYLYKDKLIRPGEVVVSVADEPSVEVDLGDEKED